MRSIRPLVAAVVLGLLASGCGGSGLLKTRGRVMKGGAPFLPGPGQDVRVTFVPVLPNNQRAHDYYVAHYNDADGTFQVVGKDLKGLPPGRYRVMIELEEKRRDLFKGKFDDTKSPFVFDVDGGTGEIVIDLDRPPTKT
jgi:hypothetical protein